VTLKLKYFSIVISRDHSHYKPFWWVLSTLPFQMHSYVSIVLGLPIILVPQRSSLTWTAIIILTT